MWVPEFKNILARAWHFSSSSDGASSDAARPFLTPEEFQAELAILGLSGKEFQLTDYAEALEEYLGLSIAISVIPDAHYPEIVRMLAQRGRMAQLRYREDPPGAAIFVLSSLPPIVRTLSLYHELGHLAAGDPLGTRRDGSAVGQPQPAGMRLARRPPLPNEEGREKEADMRAVYSLLAGSLGPEHYYAEKMYDVV